MPSDARVRTSWRGCSRTRAMGTPRRTPDADAVSLNSHLCRISRLGFTLCERMQLTDDDAEPLHVHRSPPGAGCKRAVPCPSGWNAEVAKSLDDADIECCVRREVRREMRWLANTVVQQDSQPSLRCRGPRQYRRQRVAPSDAVERPLSSLLVS
ncbi:hypothetical protein FB451DRAFT_1412297 [Mycena latifolia]|nr:hypothetical protein FB451DRAFT_1412297 [Mycena latifolia]